MVLRRLSLLAAAAPVLALAGPLVTQVRLPAVFTDHIVLQRGMPVPVWGSAADGEAVTVLFRGQTLSTRAIGGQWRVWLKAMPAGGPYVLTVRGRTTITLRDVMVGEVWVCSGQSNMVLELVKTDNGAAAIRTSAQWGIRLFTSGSRVGWRAAGPTTVRRFSAVAFYFGRALARKLQVPVGLVQAAVGGTRVAMWQWGGRWYDARIAPIAPFAVRGVIWYQGESDARPGLSADYGSRFRSLIRQWRVTWGRADLPFLWVQLPPYTKLASAPHWMYLREAQLEALAVPDTSMATLMDMKPAGIHPTTKLPVGERLALAARGLAYGENVVRGGPIFDPGQTQVVGSELRVGFRQTGSGLVARGGTLTGFEVAGSDLVYRTATARILGSRVGLSSPSVPRPAAVRYAWGMFPAATLANREGLPASPFRSLAAWVAFGKGCGRTPLPALEATLLPRRARPYELRLFDLPPGQPGFVFTGLSAQRWGSLRLPLDLGPAGMPGCTLLASGELRSGFVTGLTGDAVLRFQVPNDTALHGVSLFHQGFVADPGANALGLVATNGGRGRIGPP